MTPTDFTKLIPELSSWNNGAGITPEDWVGCVGNFELAIGYSRLFWPDFVEHDGLVFLADGFSDDGYRDWTRHSSGDRRAVETVMNHRHVFDHFSHHGGTASEEQVVYLGRVLKEIWQAKLARDFPGRRFVVSFPEDPVDYLTDYEVTFWQE